MLKYDICRTRARSFLFGQTRFSGYWGATLSSWCQDGGLHRVLWELHRVLCGSYTEYFVSRTECCGWGNRPPHPLQNMPSTSRKGGKRELGMGMGVGPNFSYNILNHKCPSRAQLRKRTQRVQPKPTNGMLFALILMYTRSKFSIQSDTDAQSYGPHKSTMPSRAQRAKIHKKRIKTEL